MDDTEYTYAVARIRAKEVSLFSQSDIDQLIGCKNEAQCLAFLSEKGWGDSDTPVNPEALLIREREKTWELMRELVDDMSVFDVLTYPNLFHNLKAAIKEVAAGGTGRNTFYNDCVIEKEKLLEIVKEHNFSSLPAIMADAARDAYETLLHTHDGQLCDIIIDRAALHAICQAGRDAKEEIIKNYAESTVAIADIKIAVRSLKTKKSMDFMMKAMAECDTLDIHALANAALSGMEAICEYLNGTGYAKGSEALASSASAFERWCDNQIIDTIRAELYHSFSIGPLVAYVIARENEIKTVRIILTGKQNDLPEDFIRERVRKMYV